MPALVASDKPSQRQHDDDSVVLCNLPSDATGVNVAGSIMDMVAGDLMSR